LLLILAHVHATAKALGADDDAFFAGGHFERVVLHVFAGSAEDGMKQLLFGGQLALALGSNLADQDVAGTDTRADLHDAALVQASEGAFGDVGDIAGELFATELGFAD